MKSRTVKQTDIGTIPEEWEIVSLGDVCSKIGSGITPRGAEKVYKQSGIALIRSQNVYNNSFRKEGLVYLDEATAREMENVAVEREDVLLNITGDSVARCCTVPEEILPARVNQHVSIIRTDGGEVNPVFLRYYLTNPRMQATMLSLGESGGTRNALTKGMIEKFLIPKPALVEQTEIARVLSNFDSKIELNQQMNRTLESIGTAIFKHWFTDFEFPNEQGRPYKYSGGAMVYSEELGREIPSGWGADRLGNHSIIKGRIGWKGLQVSEYVEEGPFIVGGTQLVNNRVNWDECPRVPQTRYDESPEIMLRRGDILMTKDGTIGKLAFVDEVREPATVASGIFVIRSHSSIINQMYLWNYFKSYAFGSLVESRVEGSVIPHLYQRDITEMTIVLPTSRIASQFEAAANAIQGRFDANSENSRSLNKMRDFLLPKFMSGKVRVPVEVR